VASGELAAKLSVAGAVEPADGTLAEPDAEPADVTVAEPDAEPDDATAVALATEDGAADAVGTDTGAPWPSACMGSPRQNPVQTNRNRLREATVAARLNHAALRPRRPCLLPISAQHQMMPVGHLTGQTSDDAP
jgi:hypothetical protein